MNGLRVYVDRKVTGVGDSDLVFYSRRSLGPYYRWSYEDRLEQWRVARMHSCDFSSKELCTSRWRTVPSLLQVRLKVHYDE